MRKGKLVFEIVQGVIPGFIIEGYDTTKGQETREQNRLIPIN
jgi:hypothetical protein